MLSGLFFHINDLQKLKRTTLNDLQKLKRTTPLIPQQHFFVLILKNNSSFHYIP